jgi:hypothetical protein
MKIRLTQGYFAEIDDEDFELIKNSNWSLSKRRSGIYAQASIGGKLQSMHRVILGLTDSPNLVVDHKDGNGLNNKRNNIRACTIGQNNQNVGLSKLNKCGFKGVYKMRRRRLMSLSNR